MSKSKESPKHDSKAKESPKNENKAKESLKNESKAKGSKPEHAEKCDMGSKCDTKPMADKNDKNAKKQSSPDDSKKTKAQQAHPKYCPPPRDSSAGRISPPQQQQQNVSQHQMVNMRKQPVSSSSAPLFAVEAWLSRRPRLAKFLLLCPQDKPPVDDRAMTANPLIGSIQALKRRAHSDEALRLLQQVAAQVRPVMQSRGWRVLVLREFYPNDQRLLGLNVNRGAEIRIRLRSAHNDTQFLGYGDLVGTMLHELAHNERGPHDAVFYALLDQLKAELQALMDRGYAGDGFFSPGASVGGLARNAPRHRAREQALKAIGARARRGAPARSLASDGSRPLQHWLALQAQFSPAQMAAQALERRLRDDRWCGGSSDAGLLAPDMEPIVILDSDSEEPGAIVIVDSD
ncbi:hypothetical protein EV174_004651 [Coemansia sp. RSA 2320]|nr:hypothetical protein EV174_004651 [Coemansia sp. RSA 2320]